MQTVQKYLVYAALALFIYMPFHIFLALWLSAFTGGLDAWKIAKDVFTAALTLISVALVFATQKHTRLYVWLVGLTALYGLHHLGIMFFTNQPLDTGFLSTTYNVRLFCFLLIGYSVALLVPKQFNARLLVRLLIITSTAICLIGIAQYLLPKDIMTHFGYSLERGVKPMFFIDDKLDLPRIMSTIRDPNSLGAFLILPITILAQALVRGWKTRRRMLLSGLLILHVWALFLTFSRSAFGATIVSLGVAFALGYQKQIRAFTKRYSYLIIAGAMILFVGAFALRDQYFVQNVIFHADESTQLDDPQELRVSLVQRGIDGIIGKPLGNGPGTAGLPSVHNENGGLLPENYFVQIGYEVGVFGLTLFLVLLGYIFWQLWQRRADQIVQALLASFVGLFLMNMVLMTWANEAVACAWFMLAGTALISVKPKKSE
jgi:hypothetical protein